MTKEQKEVYDQELIERGMLLPPQKRGPKVDDNAFEDVASELFSHDGKPVYQADSKSKKSRSKTKTSKKKKPAAKKKKP